jgi:hypothetical protein
MDAIKNMILSARPSRRLAVIRYRPIFYLYCSDAIVVIGCGPEQPHYDRALRGGYR